jgi:opine dehydrogenase
MVAGGGGNAQVIAADLALAGCEVNLFNLPQYIKKIEHIMRTKQIEKIGSVGTAGRTGVATLKKVTTDLSDAIEGVDVIIIAVPAYGHAALFEALSENLKDGQIVLIIPGNWGALRLFNLLKRKGINKGVKIAETHCCLQICRAAESWLGAGKARVIMERDRVQVAAIPAAETRTVIGTIEKLYANLVPATNVIETSLNNSNLVVHGPMMVMNTGWLEHTKGQFMIYRDGATPAVARVVDAIWDERESIIKKLGLPATPKEPFYEYIRSSRWVHDPCEVGPSSLQHRYLTEDIPYGLVPLAYFGDLLEVPTPVSDAIIELSSIGNKANYWKEGLTFKKLRLDGLTPHGILKLVNEGEY